MCFQGKDLVSFMVQRRWHGISSVDDAIKFGQRLLDGGVIHHVSDKRAFEVECLYYVLMRAELAVFLPLSRGRRDLP